MASVMPHHCTQVLIEPESVSPIPTILPKTTRLRRPRAAVQSGDLEAYGALRDDNVRWGGADETPETCVSGVIR